MLAWVVAAPKMLPLALGDAEPKPDPKVAPVDPPKTLEPPNGEVGAAVDVGGVVGDAAAEVCPKTD